MEFIGTRLMQDWWLWVWEIFDHLWYQWQGGFWTWQICDGLNGDLGDNVETHPYATFDKVFILAKIYEGQRKKKVSTTMTPWGSRFNEFPRISKSLSSPISTSYSNKNAMIKKVGTIKKGKKPLNDDVCFKCHRIGHYQSQCPNSRAFTTLEWMDIEERKNVWRAMITVRKDGVEEYMMQHTLGLYCR